MTTKEKDSAWLKRMVELEDGGSIAVGGSVSAMLISKAKRRMLKASFLSLLQEVDPEIANPEFTEHLVCLAEAWAADNGSLAEQEQKLEDWVEKQVAEQAARVK